MSRARAKPANVSDATLARKAVGLGARHRGAANATGAAARARAACGTADCASSAASSSRENGMRG